MSEIHLDDFKVIKTITVSYYNEIYLVEEKRTKILYVAKVLQKRFQIKPEAIKNLNSLQQLKYPTFVKFIGFSKHDFDHDDRFTTIWEFVKGRSLSDIIRNKDFKMPQNYNYNNTTRQIILAGVANGMKHLHESNLIHENLNPFNVLLDETFHPLISDTFMIKSVLYQEGTEDYEYYQRMTYLAPEILRDEKFESKADVYSFGIVMYELITNSLAYSRVSMADIFKISKGRYPPKFTKSIKKSLEDLIKKCLDNNVDKRPSFDEIYNKLAKDENYFLDGVDKEEFNAYIEYIENNGKSSHQNVQQSKIEKENEELKKSLSLLEIQKQRNESELKKQLDFYEETSRKQKEEIKKLQDEVKKLKGNNKISEKTAMKSMEIVDEDEINDYFKEEEIGSGGGGRVIKVSKKKFYALKEMNINKNSLSDFKHFIGEYEIINMLDHPNVIKSFGIFLSSPSKPPTIILEYFPSNLQTVIKSKTFSNEMIVFAIYQIVEGMKYVHFRKVIHRDLKPTNILVDSDGTIKICDFGISKLMTLEEQSTTLGAGTQKFMAPEIINEDVYNEKVDVYSFGVVLFFILSSGEMPKIKLFDIPMGKKAEIPDYFTPLAKKLIYECWNLNPDERPSFEEILKQLDENNYNLMKLSQKEVQNVKIFVEKHKSKIPKYQ